MLADAGSTQRAYSISNGRQYFAESSEAYFGRNDFFPFRREMNLAVYDVEGFVLHERLWTLSADEISREMKSAGSSPTDVPKRTAHPPHRSGFRCFSYAADHHIRHATVSAQRMPTSGVHCLFRGSREKPKPGRKMPRMQARHLKTRAFSRAGIAAGPQHCC